MNSFFDPILGKLRSLDPQKTDASPSGGGSSSTSSSLAPASGVSSVNSQTGDVVLTKSDIGLPNADNTSDANKPISSAAQTALDGKQTLDADLTAIAGLDSSTSGAIASDGAGWIKKTYTQFKTALGLVKGDVGLGNVDNTSDANKPVSTAQQTAIDAKVEDNITDGHTTIAPSGNAVFDALALKAPLASPTFTGTVTVPTPSGDTDASTKAYVDAIAQGLSVKQSVQLATAAALPLNTYLSGVITITATGVLTVDGVTVALNDRVLVKDESAQANNGIYSCTTAGAIGVAAVLTRATDSNTGAEILGGFTFVEKGTVNAASGFVNTNASTPTIGTTAITYTQFSGAGEITAGAALTKSGNTLDVAVDNSTIEINTDALRLKDGGTTLAKLANMATASVYYRKSASSGAPEVQTLATLKTDLGLTGTNSGDQTVPVKATGAEIDTGTDDAKFATPKAIEDSLYIKAAYADALVSDTAYAASWDGVTGIAPSKNAVYDKINSLGGGAGLTVTVNDYYTGSSDTTPWSKPAGAKAVYVQVVGAGGGGGGGSEKANAAAKAGGSGGGGGAYIDQWFNPTDLGSSEVITIGAGGTSGTQGTAGGSGANGGTGGTSDFGGQLFAPGGGGGIGGGTAFAIGGGGASFATAGSTSTAGAPASAAGVIGIGGQGASGTNTTGIAGSASERGGASGGNSAVTAITQGHGGSSMYGGAGGGGGAGSTNVPAFSTAGDGGNTGTITVGGGGAHGANGSGTQAGFGGTGGTTVGDNGFTGKGGGGGGIASGAAQNGGDGGNGIYGSGAGGGGAGTTVAGTGGAGGTGGSGRIRVITFS